MSASARSIRVRSKMRRGITLELRVPEPIATFLNGMTAAERDHFVTVAVKKSLAKAQP